MYPSLIDHWKFEDFLQWKGNNDRNSERDYLLLSEYSTALNHITQRCALDPILKSYVVKLKANSKFTKKQYRDWWTKRLTKTVIINRNTTISSSSRFTINSGENITIGSTAEQQQPQHEQAQTQEHEGQEGLAQAQRKEHKQQEEDHAQAQPQEHNHQHRDHHEQAQLQEHEQQQEQSPSTNTQHHLAPSLHAYQLNNEVTLNMEPPITNDRYQLHNQDISALFYEFQRYVQDLTTKHQMYFETHVQHILALSSVLLVKPNCLDQDLKQYMDRSTLTMISEDLAQKHGIGKSQFNRDLRSAMDGIVKKVRKGRMDKLDGMIQVLSLASQGTDHEKKIIISIAYMINKLPKDTMMGTTKEMELLTRYLDPALQPLFDDIDHNTTFRWTNTMDSNNSNNSTISTSDSLSILIGSRRPDAIISTTNGAHYGHSIGYGEVKCQNQGSNNYATSKDLIRLGTFSKNSIDQHHHKAVLSFQAIGSHITFYMTKLIHDGLYVMVEIAYLMIPTSLYELESYISHLDDVLDVLLVFYHECLTTATQDEIQVMASRKRATLRTPEINRLVDNTRDRKRRCMTSYFT